LNIHGSPAIAAVPLICHLLVSRFLCRGEGGPQGMLKITDHPNGPSRGGLPIGGSKEGMDFVLAEEVRCSAARLGLCIAPSATAVTTISLPRLLRFLWISLAKYSGVGAASEAGWRRS
jgi:hypothetical protein